MARKKKSSLKDDAPEQEAESVSQAASDEVVDAEVVETVDVADETQTESTPEAPPMSPAPIPHAKSSGGFMAGLLGGVLASGGILAALWALAPGFFSSAPSDMVPLSAELKAQEDQTAALKAEVAALKTELEGLSAPPVTGSGMEARMGTFEAEITTRFDDLASTVEQHRSTLSILEGRLAQVEARPPVFEGNASEATGELVAEMRAALEAQRTEIATLADEARMRLEAAEAEATTLRENTQTAAKIAVGRAALSRLMAALDAGGSFAASLSDLTEVTGQTIPAALSAVAETGVPTLAQLRQDFPDAARAALAATSREGLTEDAGIGDRFGAFLRAQTGARSLEPQEGNTPDAILSRAEAALSEGHIADAVKLVGQLSEIGQAEMAEWRSEAEKRLMALEAAEALAQTLAEN